MKLPIYKLWLVLLLLITSSGVYAQNGCIDSLIITHSPCSAAPGNNGRVRVTTHPVSPISSTNIAWSFGVTQIAQGFGVDTLTATLPPTGTNIFGSVPAGLYSVSATGVGNVTFSSQYFTINEPPAASPLTVPTFVINRYPSGCQTDGRVTLSATGGYGRYRYVVRGTGQRIPAGTAVTFINGTTGTVGTGGISRDSVLQTSAVFDSLPAVNNLTFCVIDSNYQTVQRFATNNSLVSTTNTTAWLPGCERCTNINLVDPISGNLTSRFPFNRTQFNFVRTGGATNNVYNNATQAATNNSPDQTASGVGATVVNSNYRYNFQVTANGNSMIDEPATAGFTPFINNNTAPDSLINCFGQDRAQIYLPVKPRNRNAAWGGTLNRNVALYGPYKYTVRGVTYKGDTVRDSAFVTSGNDVDHVTLDSIPAGRYVVIVTDNRGCSDTTDTIRINQRPRMVTRFEVVPTNDSLNGPANGTFPTCTPFNGAPLNALGTNVQPGPGPNPFCTFRMLISVDGEAFFYPNRRDAASDRLRFEFIQWPDMGTTSAPQWQLNVGAAGTAVNPVTGTAYVGLGTNAAFGSPTAGLGRTNCANASLNPAYPNDIYYNYAEGLRPGTYVVRITDETIGCSVTDTIAVLANNPLKVTANVINSNICWIRGLDKWTVAQLATPARGIATTPDTRGNLIQMVPDSSARVQLTITGGLQFATTSGFRQDQEAGVPSTVNSGFGYVNSSPTSRYNIRWHWGRPASAPGPDGLYGFTWATRIQDGEGDAVIADALRNDISIYRDTLPRTNIPTANTNSCWIGDTVHGNPTKIIGAFVTAVVTDSLGCKVFATVRLNGTVSPFIPRTVVRGTNAAIFPFSTVPNYFACNDPDKSDTLNKVAKVAIDTSAAAPITTNTAGAYKYTWFKYSSITVNPNGRPTFVTVGNAISSTSRADSLDAGTYVVFASDTFGNCSPNPCTGCYMYDTIRVHQQATQPIATGAIQNTPASNCASLTNPGGSFTVNGVTGGTNTYYFRVYSGTQIVWQSTTPVAGPTINIPGAPGTFINSLAGYTTFPQGTYRVEVIDGLDPYNETFNNPTASNHPTVERYCYFRINNVVLNGNGPSTPTIADTLNPTCYGFNDGRITVSAGPGTTGGSPNIRFYLALAASPNIPVAQSTPSTGIPLSAGTATYTFNGLQARDYVIIAERADNGCRTTSRIVSLKDKAPILADTSMVRLCPPIRSSNQPAATLPTGIYKLRNVRGGIPFTVGQAYNYRWHITNGPPSFDTLALIGTNTDTAFVPNTRQWYSVRIYDATTPTSCVTTYNFRPVPDLTPDYTLTVIVDSVKCKGAKNGSITYKIAGGTSPYQYILERNNTINPFTKSETRPDTIFFYAQLDTGNYSVGVRDANGCLVTAAVRIGEPDDTLRILPVGNTTILASKPTYHNTMPTFADTVRADRRVSGSNSGLIIGVRGGTIPGNDPNRSNAYFTDSIKVIDMTVGQMLVPDSLSFNMMPTASRSEFRSLDYIAQRVIPTATVPSNVRYYRVPLNGPTDPGATPSPSVNPTPNPCDYRGFIGRRQYMIIIKDRRGCTDTLRYSPDVDSIKVKLDTVKLQRCSGPLAGTNDAVVRATVTGGNGKYLYVWADQKDINFAAQTATLAPFVSFVGLPLQAVGTVIPVGSVVNNNLPQGKLMKAISSNSANWFVSSNTDTVWSSRTASGWIYCRVFDSSSVSMLVNGPFLGNGLSANCSPKSFDILSGDSSRIDSMKQPLAPPFQAWIADSTDRQTMCHDAFTGRVVVNILGGQLNATGSYRVRYVGPGIPLPWREFTVAKNPNGSVTSADVPAPTNTPGIQLGTGWTLVDVLDDSGCSAFITPQFVTLLNPPPVRINRDSTIVTVKNQTCYDIRDGVITIKMQSRGTPDVNSVSTGTWYRIDTITAPVSTQQRPTSEFSNVPVFGNGANSCPNCPSYLGVYGPGAGNVARYYVTARDRNGCIDTFQFTIVRPEPLKVEFRDRIIDCTFAQPDEGAVTILPSGGTPFRVPNGANGTRNGYFILWNFEQGGISFTRRDTFYEGTGRRITGMPAGRYSVAILDAAGCVAHRYIDLGAVPPLVKDTVFNVRCGVPNSGAIKLEVQVSAETSIRSYLWTATEGGIVPVGQQSAKDLINVPAGKYRCEITDTFGCKSFREVRVEQERIGRVEIKNNKPLQFCLGDSVTLVSDRPGDWTSFLWSSTAMPLQTTPSITVKQTATVFLKVRNSLTGCEAYDTIDVRVSPGSIPVITRVGDLLQSTEGSTYIWRLYDGTNPRGSVIQGATDQNYPPLVSGTYTVTVSDVTTGCTAESAPFYFTTSVDADQLNSLVKIYPNPAQTVFEVEFPAVTKETVKAELYDAIGKLVANENLAADGNVLKASFNVSTLSKGVYTLKLVNGSQVMTHKVIVK